MEDDIFEGLGVSDDADSEVCDTAPKALFFSPSCTNHIFPPTSLEEANALHHVLLYIRRCVSARADSAHVVFTLACWAAGRLQVA